MNLETAFTMDTSSIKYGPGVTCEVGYDMKQLGARRVMVLTDPNLVGTQSVAITLEALRSETIDAVLYDGVQVEPTDVSLKEAIQFAIDGKFDGYVAVGGGSTMDTAKAANLYATYPAEFLASVAGIFLARHYRYIAHFQTVGRCNQQSRVECRQLSACGRRHVGPVDRPLGVNLFDKCL